MATTVALGISSVHASAAVTPTPTDPLTPAAGPSLSAPSPASLSLAGSPSGSSPVDGAEGWSRPDLVGAQALARQVKARVEVLGERTESSALFVNADGSLTVQSFGGPRWVQRSRIVEGRPEPVWVDVDTTLVAGGVGTGAAGTVAPRAVSTGLVLSGGGDTVLARMVRDGVGVSVSAGAFGPGGRPGVLPVPVLAGNVATYAEVQAGVDLVVTATAVGFETRWVVKARPSGALNLELPVTVTGLAVRERAGGGVDYVNGDGEVVVSTAAPMMWDGRRNPLSETPVAVVNVPMTVRTSSGLPATDPAGVPAAPGAATPSVTSSVTPSVAPSGASSVPSSPAATPTTTTSPSASASPSVSPSASAPGAAAPGSRVGVNSPRVEPAGAVPGAKGASVVRFLALQPPAAFLADPGTVFPVTVDPTLSWMASQDSFVKSTAPSTAFPSDIRLHIGNDTAAVFRSFVEAPATVVSTIAGKSVSSASLRVFTSGQGSCGTGSNEAIRAWRVGAAFNSGWTWNTVPARVGAPVETIFNPAIGQFCPAGVQYGNVNITPIAQDWASGAYTNRVVELAAGQEATNAGYKRFIALENGSNQPMFEVTYTDTPSVPTNLSPAAGATIGKDSLVTSATVSDPSGAQVRARVFVQDASNGNAWVTPQAGTDCALVASGSTSTCPGVDVLNGRTYRWQVQAVNTAGTASAVTAWQNVTVDTTPPAAATVSSTAYPAGSWNPATPVAGSFTFSSASADVTSFRYWFNNAARTTVAATGTSPRTATLTLTPPVGANVLHVQALDAALNASTDAAYAFGAGVAVASPRNGDRTQASVRLLAHGPIAATKVTFQYKATSGSTWTTIPAAHVTLNGAGITWPVNTTVDAAKASSPSTLLWNVAATLGASDQAIDVQAVFADNGTGSWTSSNPPTVIVDRAAFGESYATDEIGPGSVSLLTGNYSVTATDVQVPGFNGDMTVRRSFNSFAPAVAGPFGPGWVLSLGVDTAGSAWSAVTDLGSFVKASEADGGALYFAVQADGTYEPFADTAAAGLSLSKTGTGTGTKYTVADTEGNSTVFAYASGTGTPSTSNAWRYRVESVVQPGVNQTTTTAYNGDGTPFRM
ncbi:MAG: hypothetical protein JNL54_22025, partial [Kineosporiaceae bacterium]|nr:hypothetical protein [Kineosporiaceae bacterium]